MASIVTDAYDGNLRLLNDADQELDATSVSIARHTVDFIHNLIGQVVQCLPLILVGIQQQKRAQCNQEQSCRARVDQNGFALLLVFFLSCSVELSHRAIMRKA